MNDLSPLLEDLPLVEEDMSDLPGSLLSPAPGTSSTTFPGSSTSSSAPTPTTATATTSLATTAVISHITEFPLEIQINILTYLRAYDLAAVHQSCRFYHEPSLVHGIVLHAAERVYPTDLTEGFEDQPVMSSSSGAGAASSSSNAKGAVAAKKGKKKGPHAAATTTPTTAAEPIYYTFEHLRNMELLVVVRILSRPEPPSEDHNNGPSGSAAGCGYYYVSKSWCKTALKWLEWQQERQQQYAKEAAAAAALATSHHKKNKSNKISKKQQRLRQRKYSDASPPWPNVNSDIVCCHDQLQMCSNRKSARARRRVLDKQAWKYLKKLYPESSPLEAVKGECLQCLLDTETEKKTQQQREQQLKEERKAPLSQPVLRRFYTRTRGVPMHCLKETSTAPAGVSSSGYTIGTAKDNKEDLEDKKMPAQLSTTICIEEPSSTTKTTPATNFGRCPLVPGKYYAVPRAWCHAWRKYMKTGEGPGQLLPPDASALLCDAHRLSLLPPHLESYLYGESPQLWLSKKQQLDEELDDESSSSFACLSPSPVARRTVPVVGLSPGLPDLGAADFGFLSPAELAQQQRAFITLERQREQQRERDAALQQEEAAAAAAGGRRSAGEQLDRENYCCVEILAHDELEALQNLWPRGTSIFRMSFQVLANQEVAFSTQPCRECDASGKANFCKIPKNSKAHLRAAHQARVRIYKEQKSNVAGSGNNNSSGGGGNAKLQLEY